MKSKCECGRALHPPELYPLFCACGRRHDSGITQPPKPQPSERHKPCVHRGPIIGKADCDCQNKPSVYTCDLHGICLPRMSVTAAAAMLDDGSRAIVSRSCRSCGDYRATG